MLNYQLNCDVVNIWFRIISNSYSSSRAKEPTPMYWVLRLCKMSIFSGVVLQVQQSYNVLVCYQSVPHLWFVLMSVVVIMIFFQCEVSRGAKPGSDISEATFRLWQKIVNIITVKIFWMKETGLLMPSSLSFVSFLLPLQVLIFFFQKRDLSP